MIDYILIELENWIINELLRNPLLSFTTPFNEETGELILENQYYKKKVAKYLGWKFTIITNLRNNLSKLYLEGSIHKYFAGGVNHTDFDRNALRMALNELESKFNINLDNSIIHSIEFGVNVCLPFSCKQVISDLLYYINTKPSESDYDGRGQMTKFKMTQYIVKIYNKGLQYFSKGVLPNNPDNLLRFEIHVKKMQYLINKGIKLNTLSDLLNPEIHKKLGTLLLSNFNAIVIHENSVNTGCMNPKDQQFLNDANNPNYWQKLRQKGGKKSYSRKLEKFRSLQRKNNEKNAQDCIAELIENMWNELTVNVPKLPSVKNSNMSDYYPYIVCNNKTIAETRFYCKVTGIDITHQPGKRNFISEKTLDRIEYKNPGLYCKLLLEFRPKVYSKNVNRDIAHNIRNRYTNKYHNLKRQVVYSLSQTSLFRADEVLTLNDNQKNLLQQYNIKMYGKK